MTAPCAQYLLQKKQCSVPWAGLIQFLSDTAQILQLQTISLPVFPTTPNFAYFSHICHRFFYFLLWVGGAGGADDRAVLLVLNTPSEDFNWWRYWTRLTLLAIQYTAKKKLEIVEMLPSTQLEHPKTLGRQFSQMNCSIFFPLKC